MSRTSSGLPDDQGRSMIAASGSPKPGHATSGFHAVVSGLAFA
jgi:hypothetical protein